MESDIWTNFSLARISDAVNFLGGIIAIWIAARFASVAVDKGANLVAKIIITVFGLCVIIYNIWFSQGVLWNYYWTWANLSRLKESGIELSVNSQEYLTLNPNMQEPSYLDNPVALLIYLTAFLVIIGTLWFSPKKDD